MIVLDTCAFIWLGIQRDKLTEVAMSAIQTNRLAVSDITFLEIGYLLKKDKLDLPCSGADFSNLVAEANDIEVIPLTPEIVEMALGFSEEVNKDPADRLISATTVLSEAKLVTSDRNLLEVDTIPTVW